MIVILENKSSSGSNIRTIIANSCLNRYSLGTISSSNLFSSLTNTYFIIISINNVKQLSFIFIFYSYLYLHLNLYFIVIFHSYSSDNTICFKIMSTNNNNLLTIKTTTP